MHIFHDWLGWSDPFQSKGGGPCLQQRACRYCNKIVTRVIHPPKGWHIVEAPAEGSSETTPTFAKVIPEDGERKR